MRIKKAKKVLESLEVSIIDEKTGQEAGNRSYNIPEGGSVSIHTICGDLTIKDADGDKIHHVNWQAGYSQEYSYYYKKI